MGTELTIKQTDNGRIQVEAIPVIKVVSIAKGIMGGKTVTLSYTMEAPNGEVIRKAETKVLHQGDQLHLKQLIMEISVDVNNLSHEGVAQAMKKYYEEER